MARPAMSFVHLQSAQFAAGWRLTACLLPLSLLLPPCRRPAPLQTSFALPMTSSVSFSPMGTMPPKGEGEPIRCRRCRLARCR